MAAAGLSRNRGGFGGRGLLVTFTLFSLVSFINSLVNDEELNKLVESYQDVERELYRVKAELSSTTELLNEGTNMINSMTAWIKKAVKKLPDDFPPVENFLTTLQGYMETVNAYVNSQNEMFAAQIRESEEKLKTMKKLIQYLQEYKAEL